MEYYLSDEKYPIVVQLGGSLTRVGFASESQPRGVIRSVELSRSELHSSAGVSTVSKSKWLEAMTDLFYHIFFRVLQTCSKDRTVVICENPCSPTPQREALAETLFHTFQVPSIHFVNSLMTPLYLSAIPTGLVIDIGYAETRIMGICHGLAIMRSLTPLRLGTQSILERLRLLLFERLEQNENVSFDDLTKVHTISLDTLEDLKVKHCYVNYRLTSADNPDAGSQGKVDSGSPAKAENVEFELIDEGSIEITIDPSTTLTVPGDIRWKAAEILFGNNDSCTSIADGVITCLENCGVDVRRLVAQNIIFVGGTSEMTGLKTRLALEIKSAIVSHPVLSPLLPDVCLSTLDEVLAPSVQQWTGASIVATSEALQLYTTEDYSGRKPLPDWFSLPPSSNGGLDGSMQLHGILDSQFSELESPFANLPGPLKFLTGN